MLFNEQLLLFQMQGIQKLGGHTGLFGFRDAFHLN